MPETDERSLSKILLVLMLLAGTCAAASIVFWPKTTPLSLNPNIFTGYYWGNDFLGRYFYRVVASEGPYGYWEVDAKAPGYNSYRGYYADGKLREEGEIKVTYRGLPPEPQPDNSDVKWANYYRPDGSLGGQVRDGTGEQILWYPDGKLRWKLVVKNFQRVSHEHWAPDGTLISRQSY
jgi:hypothetical protein